MARGCTICSHDEHYTINVALVQRTPYRRIAAQYGVTEQAVRRHTKKHLPELLVQSTRAVEVARADDLLGNIEHMIGRLEAFIDRAEADGDGEEFRANIAEWRKQIELLARIAGQRQEAGTVNIFVNPQWVQIEAAFMHALRDEPSARHKVIAALQEVSSDGGS
jgi:hypothetical protein